MKITYTMGRAGPALYWLQTGETLLAYLLYDQHRDSWYFNYKSEEHELGRDFIDVVMKVEQYFTIGLGD